MVKLLLEHGADVGATANEGWTLLHVAAFAGRVAIVKMLLEAGADMGVRDKDGQTPRDVAKDEGIIRLLDRHGDTHP